VNPSGKKTLAYVTLIGLSVVLGGLFFTYQGPARSEREGKEKRPIPVEVVTIQRGAIEERRTFSGTLESPAELLVAPKVSGRVVRLAADIGDSVSRGQVVAELDNDEYVQSLAQAKADLIVAMANRGEAETTLEIASRELRRVEVLRTQGITSASQYDSVVANHLQKKAQLEVAVAQLARAEAAIESARIRLGYTTIKAEWAGGDNRRVLAERYVDEGETVSAGQKLLSIVELDPLTGVIFVTEKDYTGLQVGQAAVLVTDAFPGKRFDGQIERIAPVFRETSRQARIELMVSNPGQFLKPGMFIRATVVLARVGETTVVPESALTSRHEKTGVFVLGEKGDTVSWRPVTVGIHDGQRVQIDGEGLSGRVVILGQQLLDDGSSVAVSRDPDKASDP